jgi:hypothetical protein
MAKLSRALTPPQPDMFCGLELIRLDDPSGSIPWVALSDNDNQIWHKEFGPVAEAEAFVLGAPDPVTWEWMESSGFANPLHAPFDWDAHWARIDAEAWGT